MPRLKGCLGVPRGALSIFFLLSARHWLTFNMCEYERVARWRTGRKMARLGKGYRQKRSFFHISGIFGKSVVRIFLNVHQKSFICVSSSFRMERSPSLNTSFSLDTKGGRDPLVSFAQVKCAHDRQTPFGGQFFPILSCGP